MFGWLAARSIPLCRRAPRALASRRIRPITPHAWLDLLPALGSVLYLHTRSTAVMGDVFPSGMLVSHRAFAPLLEARWLVAVCVVTDDGPREWCECVDHLGRTRARWHLLPDSDYLAWDALTASCQADTDMLARIDAQPLRPDHACVVNFRVRHLAGLDVLEHDTAVALSPLGDHLAARIAHAEAVLLAS
ncbi:hypothetical protein DWU98_07765 [Dyella monticola]|uniref:Hemin transport protein n=1 Tax=Dyella monticola TaxID=1927958 RepID=A0A370X3N5_9GAMM|nr:hypothetical protein [Dyella monticola]RDS83019.1 hypothetical protein DWU98_07765 [Dyella monticola]